MPGLFNDHDGTAVLSPCALYRYRLGRTWDETLRPAVFVMLNPSTADAARDDPTIRRCVGFAKSWGCGGIVVVNLYGWRSADSRALRAAADPVGPDNDRHIRAAAEQGHPVVAAWGSVGKPESRVRRVRELLAEVGVPVKCLGLTKFGGPRHPLYVRADAALLDYPTR